MGESVQLRAADGHRLTAYRAVPDGEAKGGVVVVQEIFGVNAHIRDVCERFAELGYEAVAPALFDRLRPGVELGYDEAGSPKAGSWSPNSAGTSRCSTSGRRQPASGRRQGGGGRLLLGRLGRPGWPAAGSTSPASSAYYGRHIVELPNEKPRCPMILHFGAEDALIPRENVETIRAAYSRTCRSTSTPAPATVSTATAVPTSGRTRRGWHWRARWHCSPAPCADARDRHVREQRLSLTLSNHRREPRNPMSDRLAVGLVGFAMVCIATSIWPAPIVVARSGARVDSSQPGRYANLRTRLWISIVATLLAIARNPCLRHAGARKRRARASGIRRRCRIKHRTVAQRNSGLPRNVRLNGLHAGSPDGSWLTSALLQPHCVVQLAYVVRVFATAMA